MKNRKKKNREKQNGCMINKEVKEKFACLCVTHKKNTKRGEVLITTV